MRSLLAFVAATGCAPAVLDPAAPTTLFDGGDGLEVTLDRVLTGTVTADITLDAAEPWILDGLVIIDGGVTLTIEPGTVIYGNPSTRGTLVVSRGAKIVADGTSSDPIVFTSPRARGARRAGDWGGIAINGWAPVNGCSNAPCELEGEADTGPYGGDQPNDDSGVLRYVRIEFAGALYTPEDELNGIAMQGVGRGTVIDHVQLHVLADDGIEFFGGTVDVRHVVVTGANDDSFDWTAGWQGTAQFVVLQQHPGSGDRGIEADNNEDDFDASPRSLPSLANLTIIGRDEGPNALLFRRGTGVQLSNSIVTNWGVCVDIQDDLTWENGYAGSFPTGDLGLRGSWFDCGTPYSEGAWSSHTVETLLTEDNPGNVFGDPLLVSPTDPDSPDFRLAGTSGALTGALPLASTFESVPFVGAFDDQDDWTAGWTTTGTN